MKVYARPFDLLSTNPKIRIIIPGFPFLILSLNSMIASMFSYFVLHDLIFRDNNVSSINEAHCEPTLITLTTQMESYDLAFIHRPGKGMCPLLKSRFPVAQIKE